MKHATVRHTVHRRLSATVALTAGAAVLAVAALSGCSSSTTSVPGGSAKGEKAVIDSAPVASSSTVSANSWAAAIKKRGYLRVGGTDSAPLFSQKDPATGQLSGFDASLSKMLARYIIGKPSTKLSLVSVDTREVLLQNNSVDTVFATYTITPARAKRVAFAGPYYSSGDAILVKSANKDITKVSDLNGKTVATESSSTAALDIKKYAPKAKVQLFQENPQCVAAVKQGRADAYVLDQAILVGDASADKSVKVVGQPFTKEPYGIGVTKSDPQAKQFVDDWLKKIFADGTWAKLWKATVGTVVKGNAPAPPAIGSVPGS